MRWFIQSAKCIHPTNRRSAPLISRLDIWRPPVYLGQSRHHKRTIALPVAMSGLLFIINALLILLKSSSSLATPQHDASSSAATSASSESFSLLASNPLLPPVRLKVYRGQWTPLLRKHLPITKRVLRGGRHVCRIEVEELAPIFSVVGHLEPKVCHYNPLFFLSTDYFSVTAQNGIWWGVLTCDLIPSVILISPHLCYCRKLVT